jgi:Zn-finger nucleic acid-binding protein
VLEPSVDPVTSVELHSCPQCGGAFLPHGALGRIEIAARASGRERDAASDQFRRAFARPRVFGQEDVEKVPLDCPACDNPMIEREWGFTSLVFVDVCLECRGTWLDEGELATLRRFYGSAG